MYVNLPGAIYMTIPDNILTLQGELPAGVRLIAVTKTQSVDRIREAYAAGQRIFGENKAREMEEKHPQLPPDIEWHMIGHLQRNKVKYIAGFVSMIQSVDSLELLTEINLQAIKHHRLIDCLLQIYIAAEETKFGLGLDEARHLLMSNEFKSMKNVRIRGVMGIATFTNDIDTVRKEFRNLSATFRLLRDNFFTADSGFNEISMGMSDDYNIAIEEGSTMVRIGTRIFGIRERKD